MNHCGEKMDDCKCKPINIKYKHAIPLPFKPFYTDRAFVPIRISKLIAISDKFGQIEQFLQLPYAKQIYIIKNIENSCLNETIRKSREYNIRCVWDNLQFEYVYHTICYNISSALDIKFDTGSKILVKKIFDEEIDLNTIANLSCKELCPEGYRDIIKTIDQRSNIEQTVKATSLYYCKKCGKNQCTATRVQNRSADEGSSFYVCCLFCGNKWFGG